jgi:hypothetical protein
MLRAIFALIGLLFVITSLNDVFQSVIVPRAVGRRFRPSVYWGRGILWPLWQKQAKYLIKDDDAREDFLAAFAPTNLITTLMLWSLMLVIGYGLMVYALGSQMHPVITTFGDAFYFAGTSFFTIGFGDFYGTTGWTRLLSLAAGASGFGVISSTTAYLFAIFGAFQTREQFVVIVGARAGSPPSGVGMVTLAARNESADDLSETMREAQRWCALILETHLAYPVLAYFRSSHDYESWVGTLGTLLDAAVLTITTVECKRGEARILYNLGRHATHDLAHFFGLLDETKSDPQITIEEYDEARARLQDAGLTLTDRDIGWEHFSRLRSGYARNLSALAAFFDIPRLEWVGQKPLIQSDHMRHQIDPKALEGIDKV